MPYGITRSPATMQRGVAVPCVHLGRRAGVDLVFLSELLPANLGIRYFSFSFALPDSGKF